MMLLPPFYVQGDGMKRNPERETFAMQPMVSQSANLIHIRVTFHSVTRYVIDISSI